jgi:dienelactone hydrolase
MKRRTGAPRARRQMSARKPSLTTRLRGSAALVLMVVVLLAAAGGGSAVASSSDGRARTSEPRFAVGYETVSLVDPTRGTPAWAGMPASSTRTLDTLVMYPARGRPDGASVADARPVRRGRFPVVVFLGGAGTTAMDFRQANEPWARAGYVVVAPTAPLGGLGIEQSGQARRVDLANHPDDVRFVLSELPGALSRAIRARADFDRVAVTGYSLGAWTAFAVAFDPCCRNDAIRGVVAMANGQVASGADLPALMVHGDADERVPYAAGRASFDAAPAPKFFLTLFGIGHPLTLGLQPAPTDTHVEPLPRRPDPDALMTTTTDFFDRYLKSNK